MAREYLTAARTYYVSTTGSDSNNGLSSGSPFLTIQKAIDTCYQNLDAGGQTITIQVADGTYTDPVTLKNVIGIDTGAWSTPSLILQGNTTTPANCKITTTSNNCFTGVNCTVSWLIRGFKLSTVTSGHCVESDFGSNIYLGKNEYGACAGIHLISIYGSKIEVVDSYTISGSASVHFYLKNGGQILGTTATITLSGTPAFSSFFAAAFNTGVLYAGSFTFSGSATGGRYTATNCGGIDTNGGGSNFLPGNSAGSTSAGGWYA